MTDTPTTQQPAPQPQPTAAAPKLDIAQLRAQQNFGLAVPAGIVAAVVGAGLWAAVTIATKMEIGLMSLVVGIMVGAAIRKTGKGLDQKFGILAAVCALGGSLLGSLLSAAGYLHREPLLSYLSHADAAALQSDFLRGFQGMDLLFYAIAVSAAYKGAFKYRLLRKAPPPAA